MSNYRFLPAPTYGVSEHPFVTWRDGFTPEELDKMNEYFDTLPLQPGVTFSSENEPNEEIRKSNVAWVELNQDSGWIYDRLAYITRCLNGEFYKFDLYGFSEHLQFTIYEGEDLGHYTWHQDWNAKGGAAPRKLSVTMQLSDPDDYDGGELEIFSGTTPTQCPREKGIVIAFPSFILHRVAPVTRGIRRSLVVWVCGEAFK